MATPQKIRAMAAAVEYYRPRFDALGIDAGRVLLEALWRMDAKQAPKNKFGEKRPGIPCGKGYISWRKKCGEDNAQAAQTRLKGTAEGKAYAERVRKSKGLKPRGGDGVTPGYQQKLKALAEIGESDPVIERAKKNAALPPSPSRDANRWWESLGVKGRVETMQEAQGWWKGLKEKDRKTALKSAGVKARKTSGFDKVPIAQAESLNDLGSIGSQRMIFEYAKGIESGTIKPPKAKGQLVRPMTGSPKKKAEPGATPIFKIKDEAARNKAHGDLAKRAAKGKVSPDEWMIARGFSERSRGLINSSGDLESRYPKDPKTGSTVDIPAWSKREWGEYLDLKKGGNESLGKYKERYLLDSADTFVRQRQVRQLQEAIA